MNAGHLILTHDHGSPPEIVRLMREVYDGGPDLDPSSDPKWNATIGARRIITEAEDARVTSWFPGAPLPNRLGTDLRCCPEEMPGESVFNNPPNDRRGRLVAFFWRTNVEYFLRGWARSVIFVGFNIEQLSRLQRVGARRHPLQCPTIVPPTRPEYLDGETLQPQTDPAHASFITLLTRSAREVQVFAALGSELGAVVNGDRY